MRGMGNLSDKFVGLVRVSTDTQARSGLGLKAGRDDIDSYIQSVNGTLVAVLEEVESGTHNNMIDRPTLLRALALCRRNRAILLVPKVDRLLRSTQLHSDIKRSGVSFRAVDNPHANEFTLDILVAVAANEARAISDRTRKALKAYRDGGCLSEFQRIKLEARHGKDIPPEAIAAVAGKLGADLVGSRLTKADRDKGRARATARARREAIEMYADLLPDMLAWRSEGRTLRAIAGLLNERGDRTREGVEWTKVQVWRALERARK